MTGVRWDWGTTGQGCNGTREERDRGAMGRGHIGTAPAADCVAQFVVRHYLARRALIAFLPNAGDTESALKVTVVTFLSEGYNHVHCARTCAFPEGQMDRE